MPARFTAVTPVFVVDDVEPTRTFFLNRLGFRTERDDTHDGLLVRSRLARGEVTILIRTPADVRGDTEETEERHFGTSMIFIDVDDVELLVPEIADADIIVPFRTTADGLHEIGVREPGGNLVMFTSKRHPSALTPED